jgi:beta-lactamase class C
MRKFMAAAILTTAFITPAQAAPTDDARVKSMVDAAVKPMMAKYAIPGMAVGVTANGKSYIFDYGVTAKGGKPVTHDTLFELGSISKTFLVTLTALEAEEGTLSLSDSAGKYLPQVKGTPFADVKLMNLATHTAGGFPLQVPDAVTNQAQLMAWLRHWKPVYAARTKRSYANPSIGMLGVIVARAAHRDFAPLMEERIFPGLGLKNTFIRVPASRMADYAEGYTKADVPARITNGVLADEAYGVKSTAADMLHFVQENMGDSALPASWQRAIAATHTGYFQVGAMT